MHPPSAKRRETARAILGSCLAVSLLLGGAAGAQPAGGAATPAPPPRLSASEILRKMEATNNDFADQRLEEQLTVVDVDGSRKSYDFTLYQKGGVKRLIEFTSGELKGMSMLVEDRNSVYVYLPGFRKVRRVAASNMNQTLVGSDLSNDDMATVSWAEGYDVKLDHEDEGSWWLLLTPKPGEKSDYGKVIHRVDKASFGERETHYFNRAGEEVKRLVASTPKTFDGVTRYSLAVFSDPRTGHRTELETKNARYNQGLADDFFTVRQLQWGK